MIALLTAISFVPHSSEVVSWADVVEFNRVYNDDGELQFTQLVGWNDDGDGEYLSDWWRLWRKPDHAPTPRMIGGRWHVTFYDDQHHLQRRVIARSCWHSWTQFDREVEDRRGAENKYRLGLPQPQKGR